MLCPRCARETEERAAFCGACAAPLTLRDEPPPRRLDVTLDLDRRRSRTPTPGAPATGEPVLEPTPPARVALPAEAAFVGRAAESAASSRWELGRVPGDAARAEGFTAGPPPPPTAPRAPPAPALAAAPALALTESAPFAWSEEGLEQDLPAAGVEDDEPRPREIHLRRAATWRRAGAWAIDAGPLTLGVGYLGASLLRSADAALVGGTSGPDALLDLLARESAVVLSLAALLALALAVYATLAHALAGATLGKWVLGLRVTGPDGRRPSLARSAARAALAVASAGLLGLGFLLALFTRSGRSLHDLIARTWVVEAP